MSRRRKQQDRHQRRHLGDLKKGLQRGDAVLAGAALLAIPAAQRGPHLAVVAQLLARATQDVRAGRSCVPAHPLAIYAVDEPALIDTLGDDGAQIAWALGWTCVAVRDWPRATILLRMAVPALAAAESEADDAILRALRVWLADRGAPDAAGFAALVPADLRAELAAPPAVVALPAPGSPATVGEVDRAVLLAFASQSFDHATALVIDWAEAAEDERRAAIVTIAARQIAASLLRQVKHSSPTNGRSYQALVRLGRLAPLPAAIVGGLIRLIDAQLPASMTFDAPPPPALSAAVQLCAVEPQLRLLPMRWLARPLANWDDEDLDAWPPPLPRFVDAGWIAIGRSVSEVSHDANALAWTIGLWARRRDNRSDLVPDWLRDAAAATVKAGAAANWDAWPTLPEFAQTRVFVALEAGWPTALVVDLIEAWVARLDEFARPPFAELATVIVDLASSAVVDTSAPVPAPLLREAALHARHHRCRAELPGYVLDDLRALGIPMDLAEQLYVANRPIMEGGSVSAQGRALWRRFAPWAVGLDIDHLVLHVAVAADLDEVFEGVGLWIDAHCDAQGFRDAWEVLEYHLGDLGAAHHRLMNTTLMATVQRFALLIVAIGTHQIEATRQITAGMPPASMAAAYLAQVDATVGEPTATMQQATALARVWLQEVT